MSTHTTTYKNNFNNHYLFHHGGVRRPTNYKEVILVVIRIYSSSQHVLFGSRQYAII